MSPRLTMRHLACATLLLLGACRFNFDRTIGKGEIRAKLVTRTDQGFTPLPNTTATLVGTRTTVTSDSNGRVVLRNVTPGTYSLKLQHSPAGSTDVDAALLLKGVTLPPGDGLDLGQLVVGGVGAIEGTVFHNGTPVPAASVGNDELGRVVTDADGKFRIGFLPAGSYGLAISYMTAEGLAAYGLQPVETQAAQVTQVALRFEDLTQGKPGTISGQVMREETGAADSSGVAIWVARPESPDNWTLLATTGADGKFASASPVAAGLYILTAEGPDQAQVRVDPLTVLGDTTVPTIHLPAAVTLTDLDQDNVGNDHDNCPADYNPDQKDTDSDGKGDVCDDDVNGDGVPNAYQLTLSAIGSQDLSGVVGTTLPDPVGVRLVDAYGQPVPGATVSFAATGGSVSSTELMTDALGEARTTWTLGDMPQTATLTATANDALPVVFRATASSGQVDHFDLSGLPDHLKANVTYNVQVTAVDGFDNPVPTYGGTVTFASSDTDATLPADTTFTSGGSVSVKVMFSISETADLRVSEVGNTAHHGALAALAIAPAPKCGDGNIDPEINETCDDGNAVTESCAYGQTGCTVCTASCTTGPGLTSYCGDGVTDPAHGEACDDANQDNLDGCTNGCQLPPCGDGIVEPGEQCDDGNFDNTDGCTTLCQPPACGDGFLQPGEQCDDGNTVTESCPYGQPNCIVCQADCTLKAGTTSYCGDGTIDTANGETCDNGAANSDFCAYGAQSCTVCTTSCQPAVGKTSWCGDGIIDPTNGEECEDGNTDDTDGCTNSCKKAKCGDGIVEAGVEECDDGNQSNTDACLNTCKKATCGDGFTYAGVEECDDANDENLDHCTNSCKNATCGDGLVQLGEVCDDGASNSDTGAEPCDSLCRLKTCNGASLYDYSPATRTVTDLGDTGPGTLRDTVAAAVAGDVIDFAVTGTIKLTSGEILINKNLTIRGPGPSKLTIDATNGSFRILEVTAGSTVFISGVNLANANTPFLVTAPGAGFRNDGHLTFAWSALTNNWTVGDPAQSIANVGGGFYNGPGATLVVSDTDISGNHSEYRTNAAAFQNDGTTTLCRTNVANNRLNNGGGGPVINTGNLTVIGSSFWSGFTDDRGAVLYNAGGTVNLVDSTLYANAGVGNGGIYAWAGGITIERSTIAANSGGCAVQNVNGSVTLHDSLIAGNSCDVGGPIVSLGHNLIGNGDSATGGWQGTDLVGTASAPLTALFGAFSYQFGRTATLRLQQGSPAFGAADPASLQSIDQRGRVRSVTTNDIGPVETALPVTTMQPAANLTATSADLSALVTPKGLATSVVFELSTDPAFGTKTALPAIHAGSGTAPTTVLATATGLTGATTYYARATSTNLDGTWTAASVSFTTGAGP